MRNTLNRAKKTKNDEFYTLMEDIEKELSEYNCFFKGKSVYCNCDNPVKSNFWKYFHTRFSELGLRCLTCTYKDPEGSSGLVYRGGADSEILCGEALNIDGDFRSTECLKLMEQSDVIVTNPPFSLLNDFIVSVQNSGTDFIIVGNINVVVNKNIFPMFRDNRIFFGKNKVRKFINPEGKIIPLNNVLWISNIKSHRHIRTVSINKKYSDGIYHKYDNYDAINIDRLTDIPVDYDGEMGVPITIMQYAEQFEIIGGSISFAKPVTIDGTRRTGRFYLNGKRMFERIIIRNKSLCSSSE